MTFGPCCLLGMVLVAGPSGQEATRAATAAEIAFRQGAVALREGSLPEAERRFRAVTQLDPTADAAYTNLGVTLLRERRWSEAIEAFEKAEALKPGVAGVRLDLGLAYYRQGSYAQARDAFRAVVAEQAENRQARYLLGLSCFFTDDYACSVKAMEPLWPQESTSLTYLYVLGSAAGRVGSTALEERSIKQMEEVGQGSAQFHLYAGKALLGKQEYARAVVELKAAVAQEDGLPMAHYFLAIAYHGEHEEEPARQELEKEIALEPAVAYSYDELGQVDVLLGRDDQAEKAFLAAVARDPALSSSYLGLATIYRRQRKSDAALEMIDHAVELRPKSGSIRFQRAQILRALHRDQEARVEFAQAARFLKQFNDNLQATHGAANAADAKSLADAAQL